METLHPSRVSVSSFNQAVSRSNEFLSCAKTYWKIQQSKNVDGNRQLPSARPKNPKFSLASSMGPPPVSLSILEDGLTLLRAMDYGTKQLQGLVRRRGHTNDPTEDIGAIVKQLEQDFKELTNYCEQILEIRRRKQEQRHWELVVQWFQQVSTHHSEQLQECLKLRGEILADQAHKRRKLVERNGRSNTKSRSRSKETETNTAVRSTSASATFLFDSPLFTATPPNRSTDKPPRRENTSIHGRLRSNSAKAVESAAAKSSSSNISLEKTDKMNSAGTRTAYGASYGTAYSSNISGGYAGYGGAGYGGSVMRQRRGGNHLSSSTISLQEQEEEEKIHSQIQIRERKRQTKQRLDEARQAESTLSEVAKLFSKMSTLITQQGETLEKIEDDVECALVDVSAGQEELTKLYSIKKGNRPLIIKTFLILNFLIIFMKGYKDR